MAKPALVILGIAAIFILMVGCPRLGEWFMVLVSRYVSRLPLSIKKRQSAVNFHRYLSRLRYSHYAGAMLIRRKKLQYGEFAGEMAELQEVIGDVEVSE